MKHSRLSSLVRGSVRVLLAAELLALSGTASAQTLVDIATDVTDPFNLADTEPSIAVNPQNPLEIAVVSFSEGWGPGDPAPVWKSSDGGATWRKVFQLPQPGTSPSPGDQKIAFSQNGRLHIAELGFGLAIPRCLIYRQTAGADDPLTGGALYGDDQPHLDIDRSATAFLNQLYSPWLDFSQANERSTVTFSTNFGVAVTNVGGETTPPFRTGRPASPWHRTGTPTSFTRPGRAGSQAASRTRTSVSTAPTMAA